MEELISSYAPKGFECIRVVVMTSKECDRVLDLEMLTMPRVSRKFGSWSPLLLPTASTNSVLCTLCSF